MNDVNKQQETELDRILREAASYDESAQAKKTLEARKAAAVTKAANAKAAATAKTPASARPDRGVPIEQRIMATVKANAEKKAEEKMAMEEQQAIAAQQAALRQMRENQQASEEAAEEAPAAEAVAEEAAPVEVATVAAAAVAVEAAEEAPAQPKAKALKLPKREKKEKAPKAAKEPKAPKAPKEPKPVRDLPKILTALLVLVSMVCMLWVGVAVHPDTGTATAAATEKKLNLAEKFTVSMNNAAADALSNMTYIKKLYTIPESAAVAPKPQAQFGSTNDPAVVQAVVDQAAELLDGQTLAWNPGLPFWDGEPIQYYYDETILAITWKEIINGNMVTFGEVKLAHGSQLRRALAGNQYGSSVEEYPTNMAKNVNAVLAINGDFYNFRDLGITVYQRQLYRHAPKSVDTAYFTASGDMIFSKRGELTDKAEAEKFVQDNDAIFSVAFGPILVEDGQKVTTTQYPIGEIEKKYSRTAIGQRDDLHYILMTVNYEGPCQVTCTLAQATEYIYAKGVEKAYALDGGQTSSMVFNGELVNRVDWGNERTMSDIIYFASAVPEGGNAE